MTLELALQNQIFRVAPLEQSIFISRRDVSFGSLQGRNVLDDTLCGSIVTNLLETLKSNEYQQPRDFVDDQLDAMGITPEECDFLYGNQHIVIPYGDVVMAIDISGQTRDIAYMQIQTIKHQILHYLFPNNFPDFLNACSEAESDIQYAYTIRQRVFGSFPLTDIDRKKIISEIFEPISDIFNQLGCPIHLDKYTTKNFVISGSTSPDNTDAKIYYVDVLNNVKQKWDIQNLVNFFGHEDPFLISLARQLEQYQTSEFKFNYV